MRILVSNDDGVESQGIRALAEALVALGEVTVCSPDREQSATSRSISLHRPLRLEEREPWGSVRRYAVDGTPTDAVYVGLNHLLRETRPDLVASGINRGANLAADVHYSGTVAAAMEACVNGVPSFAISLVGRDRDRDYSHAARFARELARRIGQHGLPKGTLLNVNVPPGEPRGVQVTRIGRRSYTAAVIEKLDPRGRAYYWIGGDEQAHERMQGSDCDAVFDHRLISVTPLHLDLTQENLIGELKQWDLPGLVD